jgi:rubrerythrin
MNSLLKNTCIAAIALALATGASAAPVKTIDNLKKAFAGETTAFSKYTQYAAVAKREGNLYAYNLFRAAARAEGFHARNHKAVLEKYGVKDVQPSKYTGKVGTTAENLADALKGESYERDTMYPEMIQTAKQEGAMDAVQTFTFAVTAEKAHAQFYGEALQNAKAGKTQQPIAFLVCPRCGETFRADAPASCPVCQTPKERFNIIR